MTLSRRLVTFVLLVAACVGCGSDVPSRWKELGFPLDAEHAEIESGDGTKLNVKYEGITATAGLFQRYKTAFEKAGYAMEKPEADEASNTYTAEFTKAGQRVRLSAGGNEKFSYVSANVM